MRFFKKIICYFKGCTYASPYFSNFQLSFCQRCGEEVCGRTFDDILPAPEDYDPIKDELMHGEED